MQAAPLNPSYKLQEIEFYTVDSQCTAILLPWGTTEHGQHPAMAVSDLEIWEIEVDAERNLPRVRCCRPGNNRRIPSDPALAASALILHTSGTTSKPKCTTITLQRCQIPLVIRMQVSR
jgi:acyl-coenzyme A synthetase/AMP-(fatty) acid ligase